MVEYFAGSAPSRMLLLLDRSKLPVSSLAEALERVRRFVRKHVISAANYSDACGRIERDGLPHFRVSYYGRLWALDEQARETYREMSLTGEVAP